MSESISDAAEELIRQTTRTTSIDRRQQIWGYYH